MKLLVLAVLAAGLGGCYGPNHLSRGLDEWGNQLYVDTPWLAQLATYTGVLSVGYILGGRLADVSPTLPTVGKPLLFAGVFQAILLASAQPLVSKMGLMMDGSRFGALVASSILFAPAIVLLATVSPFAVRLAFM